ncbi:hypothetical protein Tco_0458617 [Tanacetum coccineum]
MEGLIDEDDESSNNGWRRWDGHEITDHDQEGREYENGTEDMERCELFDDHELPVCYIRRFKMIKYSFGDDEEYVAIKEDEYDDLTRPRCKKEIDEVGEVSIFGHFKTLSLDESRSPTFDLFSDQQEYSEEEVVETMAETIEQYISKTRADYGSGIARPKIKDKDSFELKGQFLKELRDNTFSGSDHEDANEHIEKVLEIVDFSKFLILL